MYKDFKKTESLDTGFVGGSGIVWMFSGIVIGLLVGLGMYYFSNFNISNNLNATEMSRASGQKALKQSDQVATSATSEQTSVSPTSANPNKAASGNKDMGNMSMVNDAERKQQVDKKKNYTDFNFYAVLPKMDVPVGSVKAIDIRDSARDSANIIPTSSIKKQTQANSSVDKAKSQAKKQNKAAAKQGKGKYYLQIASFKRKSIANSALRTLSKRGVKAKIQKKKIKGRLWYRISVGSLDKVTAYRWKKTAEKIGHKPRITQQRK